MRLAVIGCGRRFREHIIPSVAANGSAHFVSLVDPSNAALMRSQLAMAKHGLASNLAPRQFQHYLEMPTSNVEALVVCSPNNLHYEHCRFGLRHGMLVYVEKPMACHTDHANIVLQESNSRLTASIERPYRADLKRVRRWLSEGRFGRLRSIRYVDAIQRSSDFETSWRNTPQLSGGGVLMDLGYHTIHALHWLLPEIDFPSCACEAYLEHAHLSVEKRAVVTWVGCGGVQVHADVRLTESPSAWEQLDILGDAGWLRLRRRRQRLPAQSEICWCLFPELQPRRRIVQLNGVHEVASLSQFLKREAHDPATDLETHRETVRIIESAYCDARSAVRDLPLESRSTADVRLCSERPQRLEASR